MYLQPAIALITNKKWLNRRRNESVNRMHLLQHLHCQIRHKHCKRKKRSHKFWKRNWETLISQTLSQSVFSILLGDTSMYNILAHIRHMRARGQAGMYNCTMFAFGYVTTLKDLDIKYCKHIWILGRQKHMNGREAAINTDSQIAFQVHTAT